MKMYCKLFVLEVAVWCLLYEDKTLCIFYFFFWCIPRFLLVKSHVLLLFKMASHFYAN